jgi:hypothetical protein
MKYEYEVILKNQANSIFVVGEYLQETSSFVHIYNEKEIVAYIYKPDLSMIKSRKLPEEEK